MFRVERSNGQGGWTLMMASPHRVSVDDLHGPPARADVGMGDLYGSLPIPGNLTIFAGRPGQQARVRYNDTVVEVFEWAKIPENEFVPEDEMRFLWGWKLVEQNHASIPFEQLWPMSFAG